jgi:hypothetical protein
MPRGMLDPKHAYRERERERESREKMAVTLEHIRMEVGGKSPKVLWSTPWAGTDAEFSEIAREQLESYYLPGTINIRPNLVTGPDQLAKNAEAIRLVDDDAGKELRRYDLHDLRRDQNASRT